MQVRNSALDFDPTLRVQVIEGRDPEIDDRADIVIASYNGIAGDERDVRLFRSAFKRRWRSLVLDEGHYLKSRDARRTKAIYGARTTSNGALFRRADRVWVATGSPVVAHPADLWTHYSRLFPFAVLNDADEPLTYDEWVDRYCITKHDGFGEKIVGAKNLDDLRENLAPFMQVLRSTDVLDLATPTIDTIPLTPAGIKRGYTPVLSPEALAQIERCLDADAGLDELAVPLATERRLIAEAKAAAVADAIADELDGGRDKIAVFGHHLQALDILYHRLSRFDPVLYTGGMAPATKEARKNLYINEPRCRVFIGNIDAAGIGLDGLQTVCARAIFAEASWSEVMNDQCVRRLWRSGQTRPVHVSFASLAGSIDERVQKALARKAKIIANIMQP
ncbi:DEAD/DEAH box helicase [Enterovirga sp. DB1703]|uniref:DEAD/DEAH box helicase n=1 Tax=Enterovirga aerilata TaxID=2730920 RepID=A0A849ILE0_9HYPH|nr:DEAD/DEAH box helicase [Enterovirga sp. DB1703]